MKRLLLAAIAVLSLFATLGSDARAERRVAVASIEGDRGGVVAAVVVAALESEFKVIAPKAVTRVADELAIVVNDKQAGKLMTELEVDGLVMGSVEKTEAGNKLTLRVLSLGAAKARSAWIIYGKRPKNERVRSGIRTAVSTLLEPPSDRADETEEEPQVAARRPDKPARPVRGKPAVAEKRESVGDGSADRADKDMESAEADGEAAAATDAAVQESDVASDEEVADKPRKGKKQVAALDSDDVDVDDTITKSAPEAARSSSSSLASAFISIGPSVSNRNLAFTHRAFDQAPKDYKNTFVPGARVQGELYPLAFGSDGLLSRFGIGFEFDQTIGLKVGVGGMELPTTVRHYSVDARIRLPLGKASVALIGGYGRRTFKITGGSTPLDVPDIDYSMINPGLAFRLPLGSLALFGHGRALLVMSAGEIETPKSYGSAKVTAFEAQAGLEYSINKRFGVRLTGDFAQFGYDFDGIGDESNNRDQDSTTADIGGAKDRIIGGALSLAVGY